MYVHCNVRDGKFLATERLAMQQTLRQRVHILYTGVSGLHSTHAANTLRTKLMAMCRLVLPRTQLNYIVCQLRQCIYKWAT